MVVEVEDELCEGYKSGCCCWLVENYGIVCDPLFLNKVSKRFYLVLFFWYTYIVVVVCIEVWFLFLQALRFKKIFSKQIFLFNVL